ncbi:MotA/TolQ/ExbB proton channel family protein [Dysgonomonas sp. 216]|uniref:MotA/TolQ/ExbB proton channel family protein n=1 Tax=Dysgonomonas sp. 216 TaxID=2302934 RepID=UPI0013D4662C|nr:MotA/TolQ/ExbB proton channel family protein [Dysgonomonas sp. 216]NDW19162.1 MotA/TolQ/ExbB proton channel family protein [Dysgonomonas sp. 216]
MNLFVLLQATQAATAQLTETAEAVPAEGTSYFSLVLKGGWILLPIFLLSLLAIYLIIERWLAISRMGKNDSIWMSRVIELISENKTDKALRFCLERPYASGKVIAAGLKEINNTEKDIEDAMQIEARQQLSFLERGMNYLGITASIAPMLGFLGTIFGVILIFYNISMTNDLNIANISDGLYQKMICSGAGLLVGIVAYSGFYILNGRIDRAVVNMEKAGNDALKAIKAARKSEQTGKE